MQEGLVAIATQQASHALLKISRYVLKPPGGWSGGGGGIGDEGEARWGSGVGVREIEGGSEVCAGCSLTRSAGTATFITVGRRHFTRGSGRARTCGRSVLCTSRSDPGHLVS